MSKQHWTNYWDNGNLTSFEGAHQNGYQGKILTTWTDFFSNKLHDGARLLDLCSGNGALLVIAEAVCVKNHYQSVELLGIDYSENNDLQRGNFEVKFNTDVTALPFEDDSFDVISANFGVEYANLELVVEEIDRVLSPNGTFQLVCHTHDSQIINENQQSYKCSEKLLAPNGICENLEIMFEQLDRKTLTGQMDVKVADYARDKVNHELALLHKTFGDSLFQTGVVDVLNQLLSAKDMVDKKKQFSQYANNLLVSQQRLKLLFDAALTPDNLQKLIDLLKSKFEQIDTKALTDGSLGKAGVVICGNRANDNILK